MSLQNTILAGNTSAASGDGPDCFGAITSLGHNLIGDLTDCSISNFPMSDLTGNPDLDAFIDDGTPGNGHFPLLSTSQAIDSGDNGPCPTTDQLDHPRADGDGDGIRVCDIGAVEFFPVVNDSLLLSGIETAFDPTPAAGASAGVFTVTATFSNASSSPINNPFFEVTALTGDNLLLNADGGAGGVGANLTPDVGDAVLAPGESVTTEFQVGLQTQDRFGFFVNVLGEPAP